MKHSNWLKFVSAGILAISVAIVPLTLPVSAQVETKPEEVYEDNFYWGWLSLLGLIALAGLSNKDRRGPTTYQYLTVASRTSSKR